MKLINRSIAITLLAVIVPALGNTREPDPGTEKDILCTVEVAKLVPDSSIVNNTLLLWPKGSCCTTTDCEIQKFGCPAGNGDICCYKASGNGVAAGMCDCGIDQQPQGTCF
ncbi:Uu.00g011840.m01.CDS01 [Anthostomella pinea]|uniref:Uu.00g011840.m01.CDS01 n=1 Tax=Anthostomella pinea TaxID=933095 RepID=A0AAI8VYR2_9PEZI|nr:Uu.00g011840.m01.CDS01 [Anthostomella pinea]